MRALLAVAIFGLLSGSLPAAATDEFESIFDGRTLEGWEGNAEMFRIEDGAIVAGTLDEPIKHNEFLCTKKDYGNFELRLKFKVLGAGANAGVQFRSRRIPNHHEVKGYQADLGDDYWGRAYDESRRNKVLAAPVAADVTEVLKADDWNDYTIRAEGDHIQLWINGVKTVDYTESESQGIEETGIIGLQIHGGGPSEAWYRDIKIKPL